jgi:hypothetical protein
MSLEKIGGIFTINQEKTMEKVKQEAKRIWNLAMGNKKATAVVVVIIVFIIISI